MSVNLSIYWKVGSSGSDFIYNEKNYKIGSLILYLGDKGENFTAKIPSKTSMNQETSLVLSEHKLKFITCSESVAKIIMITARLFPKDNTKPIEVSVRLPKMASFSSGKSYKITVTNEKTGLEACYSDLL